MPTTRAAAAKNVNNSGQVNTPAGNTNNNTGQVNAPTRNANNNSGQVKTPAKARTKREAGKTVKQLKEEAKEKKRKEEQDNLQQVTEIEQQAAESYATTANTTPAGPSRTRVGKVKQVYGVRTLTATTSKTEPTTSNPRQRGPPSGSPEPLGSLQNAPKGKEPVCKVREVVQPTGDAKCSDRGKNVGRGVKRTHVDDPSVSYFNSSAEGGIYSLVCWIGFYTCGKTYPKCGTETKGHHCCGSHPNRPVPWFQRRHRKSQCRWYSRSIEGDRVHRSQQSILQS